MLKDITKFSGNIVVEIFDCDGNLKQKKLIPNLVVGKSFIAARLTTNNVGPISHLAIGSGTTSPTTENTTLENESNRFALTSVSSTSNASIFVTTLTAGQGPYTFTEAGLLNAASSGNLLCRSVFSSTTKSADDTMTITWTVSNS